MEAPAHLPVKEHDALAFEFIPPITINLDGTPGNAPKILQGATYQIDFQILDSNGAPKNMSEWVGTTPLCQFKNKYLDDGGATSIANGAPLNSPQPGTLTWPNGGTDGILRMSMIATHTQLANMLHGPGVYDIDIFHTATGYVTRIFQGTWLVDWEVSRGVGGTGW